MGGPPRTHLGSGTPPPPSTLGSGPMWSQPAFVLLGCMHVSLGFTTQVRSCGSGVLSRGSSLGYRTPMRVLEAGPPQREHDPEDALPSQMSDAWGRQPYGCGLWLWRGKLRISKSLREVPEAFGKRSGLGEPIPSWGCLELLTCTWKQCPCPAGQAAAGPPQGPWRGLKSHLDRRKSCSANYQGPPEQTPHRTKL